MMYQPYYQPFQQQQMPDFLRSQYQQSPQRQKSRISDLSIHCSYKPDKAGYDACDADQITHLIMPAVKPVVLFLQAFYFHLCIDCCLDSIRKEHVLSSYLSIIFPHFLQKYILRLRVPSSYSVTQNSCLQSACIILLIISRTLFHRSVRKSIRKESAPRYRRRLPASC